MLAVDHGESWARLAATVMRERTHLGYPSRAAFARMAGLSPSVLGRIERAERGSYDPATLSRLEQALQWEHGSADRVLRGLAPKRITDPDLEALHVAWRDLPPGARRILRLLAEQGARAQRGH